MKVIARIPALADTAASQPVAARHDHAEEAATKSPSPCRPSGRPARLRQPRSAFPTASVSVLAVLAVIVWTLASWNDARRLERTRQERLARFHAPVTTPETFSR